MQAKADDPKYWEERAEEARTVASVMVDELTRYMMLEVAQGYDQLAKAARGRQPVKDWGDNVVEFKRSISSRG